MTVYTVGHSTRDLDDFVALVARHGIAHLADVRAFPASRRYPHFNSEPLAAALAARGIAYSHHPALGGRRGPSRTSRNAAWRNAGFRGYADYMQTDEFWRAIDRLLATASRTLTAVMCAEAVPWRCHRSLIADALLVRGTSVLHILDAGARPHVLPSFAGVHDGRVTYPPTGAGDPAQLELGAER